MPNVTIDDVAKYSGVGRATVPREGGYIAAQDAGIDALPERTIITRR